MSDLSNSYSKSTSFMTKATKSSISTNEQINLFNYINIETELEASDKAIILKPLEKEFIYTKDVQKLKESVAQGSEELNSKQIISHINSKYCSIPLNELIFETSNHLEFKLTEIYKFEKVIGEGAFGVVVKVSPLFSNEIGHKFKSKKSALALKIIPIKDFNLVSSIRSEVKLLMSIDSVRVLKVYNLFENLNYMVIEMEYITGTTLREFIINRYMNGEDYIFYEKEVSLIVKGILEGLAVLHNLNIIHRDIKPDNLMFGKLNDIGSIKIIDLGLFTRIEDSTEFCNDMCGTLHYMAPEMVYKKPIYNEAVDIWACGIILYMLLSGGVHPISKPYEWTGEKDYVKKLKTNNFKWEFKENFSLLGKNLFTRLSNWNKFQRIDVYIALKHPFVTRDREQKFIPISYMEKSAFQERKSQFKNVSFYIIIYLFNRCLKLL